MLKTYPHFSTRLFSCSGQSLIIPLVSVCRLCSRYKNGYNLAIKVSPKRLRKFGCNNEPHNRGNEPGYSCYLLKTCILQSL